jgi:hypothetical protein
MDEVTARATLVPFAAEEGGALAATLDRSQIESALGDEDAEPELLLDVTRTRPGTDESETRRIAISWDREDLKAVLGSSPRDEVTFAVDGKSLAYAFDQGDVEAHGLRNKAAVLTIAVVTAGAGAASAQGAVMVETGGAAGSSGLADSYTTMENSRSALVSGATADSATLGAGYTAMENTRSELTAQSTDDSSALSDAYTAAETSRAELASASSTDATEGTGVLSSAYTAAENARADLIGTADDTGSAVSSDDGISISAPDPATVGAGAGVVALAIAAAAFAARTRRREGLA